MRGGAAGRSPRPSPLGSSASAGVHHRHRTPARLSPRNRDRLCNLVTHLDNSIVQWGRGRRGGAVRAGPGRTGDDAAAVSFADPGARPHAPAAGTGRGVAHRPRNCRGFLQELRQARGRPPGGGRPSVQQAGRPVGRSRLVSVSAGEPVRSILLDLVLHTYGPIHVVTAAAWAKPKGAFLSAVKANPLAIVPLDSPHLGEAS